MCIRFIGKGNGLAEIVKIHGTTRRMKMPENVTDEQMRARGPAAHKARPWPAPPLERNPNVTIEEVATIVSHFPLRVVSASDLRMMRNLLIEWLISKGFEIAHAPPEDVREPSHCFHCGKEFVDGEERVFKVRAFHTSCPYKPTPGTEGEPDAQGELLDRIASQPLCNEIKPDAQGEDEFRMLAKEIFDGIFGGGLCEFDIADKIQALLQKQRPSVTRGEWMEISGYINRGEWTGVDLLVWLADKGIEVKD